MASILAYFSNRFLWVLFLGCGIIPSNLYAQRSIANQQHVWLNVSEKVALNEKQSISGLYSLRRNDFIQNWQQSLIRVNANHKVSTSFTATLGYDFVVNFPYGEQPISERFFEHRIVEQFSIKNNINKWEVKHQYRVEQRFMLFPQWLSIRSI